MKNSALLGWAILTTGLLLASGLLLVVGLALGTPVLADNQSPTASPITLPQATPPPSPTPMVIPTATPEPSPHITPTPAPDPASDEFVEWADRMCNWGHVRIEDTIQEGETVFLLWYIDDRNGSWSDIPEKYEDFYSTFQIERAVDEYKGKDELAWELVTVVLADFIWEGPAESGEWIYRVALVEVGSGNESAPCPTPLNWDETVIHVSLPPTEKEWSAFVPTICADLEVIDFEGIGYWEDTELYWGISAEYLSLPQPRFYEFGLDFAVEWQSEGPEDWHANELIGYSDHWETGYLFNGPAYPGRATFRVAISGINAGYDREYFFPCQGELRWFELEVDSPTLEERAALEAEQEILLAEATRCVRKAFASNISEEALPIVEKYMDELIAEWLPLGQGPESNAEMARYAMLMCALGSGQGEAEMGFWAFLLLFDSW